MDDDFEQIIVPLEAGSEWRFELEADENIAIRVSCCFCASPAVGAAAAVLCSVYGVPVAAAADAAMTAAASSEWLPAACLSR